MGEPDEHLPDELPVDEESPHGGSGDHGMQPHANELPDELPLSEEECVGPTSSAVGHIGNMSGEALEDLDAQDGSSNSTHGRGDVQGAPAEGGLRKRRGYKDPVLLEAFREAEALVAQTEAQQHVPAGAACDSHGDLGQRTLRFTKDSVKLTRIPREMLQDLAPKIVQGFALESPLEAPLHVAKTLAHAPGSNLDDEVVRVGSHLLKGGVVALRSKRVLCDELGIDERKLGRILPRLGQGVLLQEFMQRRAIEDNLARRIPKKDLLFYLDFAAYDETPLAVNLKGEEIAFVKASKEPPPQAEEAAAAGQHMVNFLQHKQLRLSTSASSQKILQHFQAGYMLLRAKDTFVILKLPTLSQLAVLESGNSDVLALCQLRMSTATRAAKAFHHQCRAVCTDSAPVNIVCERKVAKQRGDECSRLHILCEVHRVSLIHGKTLSLLSENIKGMIKTALCLRTGTTLNKFRLCLRDEIDARVEILHGRPSNEAILHKRRLFALFLRHGRNLLLKRLLMTVCPNGDWRSPRVQYHVPPGATSDRRSVVNHLATGLVAALCATKPHVYAQHRWTGCDIATDELSLIEACHELLSSTFKRMVLLYQPYLARMFAKPPPSFLGASLEIADSADAADGAQEGDGDAAEGENETAHDDGLGRSETKGEQQPDFAKINAARRRDAAQWLCASPFGHLVLQRLIMEPLRELLARYLHITSAEWEKEQECRAAAAMQSGNSGFNSRDFRLAIAGTGRLDKRFVDQVHKLFFATEMWGALPVKCYTVSFRALAFRCISRLGCTHKQLLAWNHERFPIRLFALLEEPDLAPELAETPECLLDEWSAALRKHHPDFSGDLFRYKLLLCGVAVWLDIAPIEAKHATIRRMLTLASTHTHGQAFHELSALFVCLQARGRAADFAPWQARRRKKAELRKYAKVKRQAKAVLGSWSQGASFVHSIQEGIPKTT